MDSLTFACPRCARQMTIGADFAARPVRCPQCKQVVTAPAASPELMTDTRERPESIFAEPGEEDSLFASGEVARVELPPQPPPPPEPPAGPWSALSDRPAPAGTEPPPFAVPPPPETSRQNWLLIAVSVYAALATAVAVWGWLRPVTPPVPSVPARAAR